VVVFQIVHLQEESNGIEKVFVKGKLENETCHIPPLSLTSLSTTGPALPFLSHFVLSHLLLAITLLTLLLLLFLVSCL
jgi:hypothetical protein